MEFFFKEVDLEVNVEKTKNMSMSHASNEVSLEV
jgi:hypothetical protein